VIVINDRRELYRDPGARRFASGGVIARHVNRRTARTARSSTRRLHRALIRHRSVLTYADGLLSGGRRAPPGTICALVGLDARRVELRLTARGPAFCDRRAADRSVPGGEGRVRGRIASADGWPLRRITVNLAPAEAAQGGIGFRPSDRAGRAGRLPAGFRQRRSGARGSRQARSDGRLRQVGGVLPRQKARDRPA
jgi:hypothetical protein